MACIGKCRKSKPTCEACKTSASPMLFEEYLAEIKDITEKAESLPEGVMRVRALAHRSGRVTANGNLYMPTLYKREAVTIKPKLDEGEVLMYPRHPKVEKDPKTGAVSVESLSPSDAAAILRVVEVVDIEDGTADVFIEADIPKDSTVAGNMAAFIRAGAKVPISSRARGTSTKLKMTDEHPLAKANQEWIGKEINLINEDFSLRTYDFVERGASGGSKTIGYREEEKEEAVMDFDVKKLTEENWKEIGESDQIKKIIEAAVKAREEELNTEHDEDVQKLVDERVEAYFKGDDFANLVKETFEKDEAALDEAVKCADCGAAMGKSKFCPDCGTKAVAAKKESTPDEKDAKIEELVKKLEDQSKAIEDMKAENKVAKDERDSEKEEAAVQVTIDESLLGKPILVQKQVQADLDDRDNLTEENIEEIAKKVITRIEGTLKVAGIKLESLPKGEGKVTPDDADPEKKEGKKDEGKLTEEQKAHAGRLV